MRRLCVAAIVVLFASAPAGRLSAQLLNAEAPIRVGHYHLNVTSIDEHKKFWVDALGGTATKVGSTEAVRFGDVFLLLRQQKPTGPTRGTTFDHIGFAVPNVPEFAKQVVAKGYGRTVGRETAAGANAGTPAAPSPGLRTVRIPGRARRREDRARHQHGAECAADRSPSRPLHQHAVRGDGPLVHEGAQRHGAAGDDRLLLRRRPARHRLHAELLPLGAEGAAGRHARPRGRSRRLRGSQSQGVPGHTSVEGHHADDAAGARSRARRRRDRGHHRPVGDGRRADGRIGEERHDDAQVVLRRPGCRGCSCSRACPRRTRQRVQRACTSRSIRSGRSRCRITGCSARRSASQWTPTITSGSSIGPAAWTTTSRPRR